METRADDARPGRGGVLVDQLPGSGPARSRAAIWRWWSRRPAHRAASAARFAPTSSGWRQSSGALPAHRPRVHPPVRRAIDAFCDFAGTGGTFAGCAAAFKAFNPSIRCYVVEPEGAAVLAGRPVTYPNHRIQGGGYAMPICRCSSPAHVDGYLQVSDDEAFGAPGSAREEGIFAGFSSGANVAAALRLLEACRGGTVAVLMCDSGLKYLSTICGDEVGRFQANPESKFDNRSRVP